MKRHLEPVILALCAILPLAAIASAAVPAPPAATGARPKAVVVDPIRDVGPVAKGEKLNQDFEIRNDGNAPLEIIEVKPACGCTVASFDKSVAPGKSGKVHVVLETVTFTGPISKGVTVFTSDPANPQIELTVRAKVVPYIEVKPGYARYVIVRGEAKEGNIAQTLWASDGSPMEVVKVESPWPYLTVGFRQAQEGERAPDVDPKIKQWRVDVKLSSDAPVGPLAGYVTVHTTHAKQKLVEIPVSGFVRPVVAVTPPKADFGELEIKGPVRKTLEVRSFSTEPVKLIGVDPVGQGIETKIESLQEGRDYVVRVTLNPGMPKGPFHNKLTIHTDSPKSPVVEVELTGTVL
jgi:hypothetical protein